MSQASFPCRPSPPLFSMALVYLLIISFFSFQFPIDHFHLPPLSSLLVFSTLHALFLSLVSHSSFPFSCPLPSSLPLPHTLPSFPTPLPFPFFSPLLSAPCPAASFLHFFSSWTPSCLSQRACGHVAWGWLELWPRGWSEGRGTGWGERLAGGCKRERL